MTCKDYDIGFAINTETGERKEHSHLLCKIVDRIEYNHREEKIEWEEKYKKREEQFENQLKRMEILVLDAVKERNNMAKENEKMKQRIQEEVKKAVKEERQKCFDLACKNIISPNNQKNKKNVLPISIPPPPVVMNRPRSNTMPASMSAATIPNRPISPVLPNRNMTYIPSRERKRRCC